MDFGLDTAVWSAAGPSAARMAIVSARSPATVPVACAQM